MIYELEGSPVTAPPHKLQRKASFFSLTRPRSSHTNTNVTYSHHDSRTGSPSYTPAISVTPSDVLTPATPPSRSHATPQPNFHLSQGRILPPTTSTEDTRWEDFSPGMIRTLNEELNNDLLQGIALLAYGQLEGAIFQIDCALFRASASASILPDMVSKCNLYRGACLVELKRWKEARQALVGAAACKDLNGRVQVLLREVDSGETRARKGTSRKWEEGRERRLSWVAALSW